MAQSALINKQEAENGHRVHKLCSKVHSYNCKGKSNIEPNK